MEKPPLFIHRFFRDPQQSFFLFAPRGTGKSTLIKTHFSHAMYIDLLNPEVLRGYHARPKRLYNLSEWEKQPKTLIIDGAQNAPSLLSVIPTLMKKHKQARFILTGSSNRKLRQGLLKEQALVKCIHPFMAAELSDQFTLKRSLELGMLPVILGAKDPRKSLQAYVGLYLKKEIPSECLIRNLESFSRFLEIVSFSHAAVFNLTNVARECKVSRKTIERYIKILEELLLAYKLPIFANVAQVKVLEACLAQKSISRPRRCSAACCASSSHRAQRALSNHPKFYLFDAGVFRALRPKGPLDRAEEIEGAALEGLVVQHLKAWNDYSDEQHDLGFWRTRSGLEVDVVIYGPKEFCAIEIKNSKKVHSQDTKPLEEFIRDYPMAKGILLYRGTERLSKNGILCLPCEEFLKNMRPNKPLWEK